MNNKSFYLNLIHNEELKNASHNYLQTHSIRFQCLLDLCNNFKPNFNNTVLDIGRSYLSNLLCKQYESVSTLGLPLSSSSKFGHESGLDNQANFKEHIIFDLNDFERDATIETSSRFDVIVFAETLEHLYAAPELVLHGLSKLLNVGGIIICQTPNACSLNKRLLMLFGRNPYELLRINRMNRGHIREYTRDELIRIGEISHLYVLYHKYFDYFPPNGDIKKKFFIYILKLLSIFFPQFSRGQTIIFIKK